MTDFNTLPSLVKRASLLANQHEFANSCLEEVGRLLRILSGFKPGAKIAEIGTGLGVGSAWLLSGMDSTASLITIEQDAERAQLVREIFSGIENVCILAGDWKVILCHGPFDFVFVDAKPAKYDEAELLVDSVNVDGMIILDDFTPIEHWPAEWKGKPDLIRDIWFNNDRLLCTELRTSEKNSVLLARRVK